MNESALICPWSSFTRGSTTFCEASLCSWVESPGIAWAGLVYIAIGIYLYRQNKSLPPFSWILGLFPFFAVMMGVGSLLYHSSHTLIFQIWDVGAMFLLGNGILLFNLEELFKIKKTKKIFWIAIVIELGLFISLQGKSGPIILGILILCFIVTEFFVKRPDRKFLWVSLGIFAIGGMALWIEHRSGLCNPDNHLFQWHAVWDSCSAFTYLTLYRYFSLARR